MKRRVGLGSEVESHPGGEAQQTSPGVTCSDTNPNFMQYMDVYGGFLKWWYPEIIHFNRVFHCKPPSILGVFPLFLETPIYLQGKSLVKLHPGRLKKLVHLQPSPMKGKENDLNQTSMIMFHVNLQGCIPNI